MQGDESTTATPARPTWRDAVSLLRPHQWYKNLIVFAGLIFSLSFFDPNNVLRAIAGFAIFCIASGGVYALNDVYDAPKDRLHPTKKNRPVAAGRISTTAGVALGLTCVIAAVLLGWRLQPSFDAALVAYLLLQALYIPVLKEHVFLDLFSISFGLILRAIAGVVLAGVFLSPWLLLCTFFLALFLGLGKRRSEVRILGDSARDHRPSLKHYSEQLLNQSLTVVMATIVLSYSMYTFFHPNQWMMLTIPFVLYGMFRYLFLEIERGQGGEPEAIFRDIPSLLNLMFWGVTVVVVLVAGPDLLRDYWHRFV